MSDCILGGHVDVAIGRDGFDGRSQSMIADMSKLQAGQYISGLLTVTGCRGGREEADTVFIIV